MSGWMRKEKEKKWNRVVKCKSEKESVSKKRVREKKEKRLMYIV